MSLTEYLVWLLRQNIQKQLTSTAYQEVHLILQKEGDKKCENSSPLELGEPHETKRNEKCMEKLR